MRFSEVNGRKVVSTSSAGTVGKVKGFLVDPASRSVVGLKLKKTDSGSVVSWADLTAVGADAVTVSDVSKITDPGGALAGFSGKDHRVLGKRVLAASGDELGKVKDVDFDPGTGTITALILTSEEVRGIRLLGVGSYAVVVATD